MRKITLELRYLGGGYFDIFCDDLLVKRHSYSSGLPYDVEGIVGSRMYKMHDWDAEDQAERMARADQIDREKAMIASQKDLQAAILALTRVLAAQEPQLREPEKKVDEDKPE